MRTIEDLEKVKKLLNYNPDTGIFTWLKNRAGKARAGTRAGTLKKSGYIVIKFGGVEFFVQRLAWFYMTGEWPRGVIDHINGITNDNRWLNLRDVTQKVNSNNTLQFIHCVMLCKDKTYKAEIIINKTNYNLGYFNTEKEAYLACCEKAYDLKEQLG